VPPHGGGMGQSVFKEVEKRMRSQIIKKLKLLGGIIIMASVTASLAACVLGSSARTERFAEKQLEKKYGIEFEAFAIGDRWGKGTAKVFLRSETGVVVECKVDKGLSELVSDDYPLALLDSQYENEVTEIFAEAGIEEMFCEFSVRGEHGGISEKVLAEIAKTESEVLNLSEFAAEDETVNASGDIVIYEESLAESRSRMSVLFRKIYDTCPVELGARVYVLDHDGYAECKEDHVQNVLSLPTLLYNDGLIYNEFAGVRKDGKLTTNSEEEVSDEEFDKAFSLGDR
jgi:hypothetical protein